MEKIVYTRVSSQDQNLARQLSDFDRDQTFEEKASAKDTDRPVLKDAIRYCRDGDEFHVHSMDRLARSLTDLKNIVDELNKKGVSVHFHKENMIFRGNENSISQLMLNIMGSFSEFERALIRERQKEGIALAKMRGAYKGRQQSISEETIENMQAEFNGGARLSALAKKYKVSRSTAYVYIDRKSRSKAKADAAGS